MRIYADCNLLPDVSTTVSSSSLTFGVCHSDLNKSGPLSSLLFFLNDTIFRVIKQWICYIPAESNLPLISSIMAWMETVTCPPHLVFPHRTHNFPLMLKWIEINLDWRLKSTFLLGLLYLRFVSKQNCYTDDNTISIIGQSLIAFNF